MFSSIPHRHPEEYHRVYVRTHSKQIRQRSIVLFLVIIAVMGVMMAPDLRRSFRYYATETTNSVSIKLQETGGMWLSAILEYFRQQTMGHPATHPELDEIDNRMHKKIETFGATSSNSGDDDSDQEQDPSVRIMFIAVMALALSTTIVMAALCVGGFVKAQVEHYELKTRYQHLLQPRNHQPSEPRIPETIVANGHSHAE
eukprot:ANDGO_05670.mRNA.1 hypothetical protein